MSQTNGYGFSLDVAQAGQKYDLRPDRVESFAAEGVVPFGAGVVAGTDAETQVAVASADTETFRGIALFTHATEQGFDRSASPASQAAEYKDEDPVSVMRQGAAWVKSEVDGVAADEAAYIDIAGSTFGWTNVSTDNLATGGVFRTSGDTDDLVVVEINLP